MSTREDTERLRRLAKAGDREARDELVRRLQRQQGLDDQMGTIYHVEICEGAEYWRVDLSTVQIVITVYDLRFYAYITKKIATHVDILVVPIWGDPPVEAPVMDLTLIEGKRHRTVRVGGRDGADRKSPVTEL